LNIHESYVTPAEHICNVLGGTAVPSGFIVRCPVPSHGKGQGDQRPSLLVSNAPGGIHVYCFAKCEAAQVRAELARRGLMPTTAAVRTFVKMDADTTAYALRLWSEGRYAEGTIVESYLLDRGLLFNPDIGLTARYHPALWFKEQRREYPGMLTLLCDLSTDQPCGIIRTFLDKDGRKLTRKMLGRAKHAAIKLGSNFIVKAARQLVVGEGFETVAAAWLMGLRPAWALGSADGLKWLPVLREVDQLTILKENDETGGAAANALARRWLRAGRSVLFSQSPIGKDHADMLARIP
jgi:hypothetical protein